MNWQTGKWCSPDGQQYPASGFTVPKHSVISHIEIKNQLEKPTSTGEKLAKDLDPHPQYAIFDLVNLRGKNSKISNISKEVFSIYNKIQVKIHTSSLSLDVCKSFTQLSHEFTKNTFIIVQFYYRKYK